MAGLTTEAMARAFDRIADVRWFVLVVIVVSFAGCSSIATPSTDQPPGAITAAPVPTNPAEPTPVPELAPGLTARGVVDPLALASAHETELSSHSETVRLRRVVTYADDELRSKRIQVTRVNANRSRFHTIITVDGSYPPFYGDRLEFYTDGETLIQATVLPNQSSYFQIPLERYREQNSIQNVISSPDAGQVFLLFAVVETRVIARIERSGRVRYRLESTRLRRPGTLAEAEDVDNPQNVSLTAVVDERGILLEYTLSYNASIDGQPVTVVSSGSHSAIGETTVPRPKWVDSALNRTDQPAAAMLSAQR